MEFLAVGNPRSNKSEVSEEAINGESEENCKGAGKAGFSSFMKLMQGSNPATQLSLSSCTGELKESYSLKNLLSQQSPFGSAIPVLAQSHLEGPARPAVPEKQSGVYPQLTIFYGGMVNVFDDISADKAQAIMQLLASSGNRGSFRSQSPPEKSVSLAIYNQPTRKVSADLPIARKQSLQRFLEKRQDRRHTKAPYATDENTKPKQNPHLMSSSPTLQAK